jgi:plasmid stabilization system protein ParE
MVFYSEREAFVLIHAVLHRSRDIRPDLFE